jgi:hypothetical protein
MSTLDIVPETVIGQIIAVLGALGGVVAILTYLDSRRRRIVAHVSFAGGNLVLENGVLRPQGNGIRPPARFHVDVKNDSAAAIAVHQIDLVCDRLETLGERVVIALRWAEDASEEDRRSLIAAEQLEHVGEAMAFSRYRAPSREAVARVAAHPSVRQAFIDAPGEPHRAFESADVVTFDLRPPQTTYSSRIARTVPERDTLTIPVELRWSNALRGRAKLHVFYEGNRRLPVTTFDFELPAVPP